MFCNREYWQIIVTPLSKGPWDLPLLEWLCSTTPLFGPLSTSPPNLLLFSSPLPSPGGKSCGRSKGLLFTAPSHHHWLTILWSQVASAPLSPTHLLSGCLILSWFRKAIPASQGSIPTWLLLQPSSFFILCESQLKLSMGACFYFFNKLKSRPFTWIKVTPWRFLNLPKIALKTQPKWMQPQFPWKAPSDGGGCASQHAHNGRSVPSALLTSADFAGRQGAGNVWTLKWCHTLRSGDHQSFQKVSYKIPHKRVLKKLSSDGTRRKVLSWIRNGPRDRNRRKRKNDWF